MTDCVRSRVDDIAHAIEQVAPLRWQESYDNAGIQVGDPQAQVTGVLLCTDVTMDVIDEAIARGYNMVVSHHPLIFHGLKKLAGRDRVERMVARAIKNDIALYCAHTNMDNAPAGVSHHMAAKLHMTDVEVLEAHDDGGTLVGSGVIGSIEPMPVMEFLRRVKAAFEVGAVRYSGDTAGMVTRVALCGGAGAFLIDRARVAGHRRHRPLRERALHRRAVCPHHRPPVFWCRGGNGAAGTQPGEIFNLTRTSRLSREITITNNYGKKRS